MTPHQVQLVQQSFDQMATESEATAQLFYDQLFLLDPTLRALFQGDMEAQGHKLMSALTLVTRWLGDPSHLLVPGVRALGQRHVGYGVRPEHYKTLGEALLWTVAHRLGAQYTTEFDAAWQAAYVLLAQAMIEAGGELAPA